MRELNFYNTLGREKQPFHPIEANKVRIYTCGPTVYDYAHIGNLRTYIFSDTLRRVLEHVGYNVTQAMNITDVGHLVGDGDEGEDKLEVGAKREGKEPLQIARYYEGRFWADMVALGIHKPTKIERASETIPAQIELIQTLINKGFAYQTETAIYFDTSRLSDYGKLTGQLLEDKKIGGRSDVIVDSEKRNPQDFALWFFLVGRYASHVLRWPSAWGEGFPGWHLECSAISRQLLGQPFDIHTGGVDHIGTHHTNEIAQSEAAYDTPLAHYWLHSEFLLVNNHRMGKSEGNLITLDEVKEKGFSPLDFRYWCLMGHYRSKLNFTWEGLEGAKRTRLAIQRRMLEKNDQEDIETYRQQVDAALADDLDTPQALAMLHEFNNATLWQIYNVVLGILESSNERGEVPADVQKLVEERNQARLAQDWVRADALRQEIYSQGFIVEDKSDQSVVYRLN